jgi:hypothetical protein
MRLRTASLCVVGVLLFVGFVKSGLARINIDTESVYKDVAFIYAADSSGQSANPSAPLGTGFFVQVPLKSDPAHSYTMFVTARHIVDPQWARCPAPNPTKLFLRLNTKNYDPTRDGTGTDFMAINLVSASGPMWVHDSSDDNVDVAVIGFDPKDMDRFDWGAVKVSEFATDDELDARAASDPVASVGLMPAYPGVKRNYPVLKIGYISNKPDELVAAQCVPNGVNRLLRVWLLSVNLVPGNSGAPILYVPEGSNGVSFGGGRPNLIGLQSMSFAGSDIAGMTPSKYIFKVIQDLNLKDADLYRGTPDKKPTNN